MKRLMIVSFCKGQNEINTDRNGSEHVKWMDQLWLPRTADFRVGETWVDIQG